MVHRRDTERAVELLREYYSALPDSEEGQLRAAIGKASNIFSSDLFQALLDIKEFYEVTLVAALTDQKPVASNQFSAQMGRTSSETNIELINPENSSSVGPNTSSDACNSGEMKSNESKTNSSSVGPNTSSDACNSGEMKSNESKTRYNHQDEDNLLINHYPFHQNSIKDMPELIQIKEKRMSEVRNICGYVSQVHTSYPKIEQSCLCMVLGRLITNCEDKNNSALCRPAVELTISS